MDEIVNLIQNVGFPITVAAYLLFKGNKDQQALKSAIERLTSAIERIENKLDK